MGSLAKARMSSLPVKELELVYLGCLVVALLAFPLWPTVDYTDMFRYADPAASLLDPMMSLKFDIDSPEHSSPLNKAVLGNKTTKLFLTYKRRILGPSRDPTLLENNSPRDLDNTLSNHSPTMFLYVFSVVSPASTFRICCHASMKIVSALSCAEGTEGHLPQM